jgi:hypothetical protein
MKLAIENALKAVVRYADYMTYQCINQDFAKYEQGLKMREDTEYILFHLTWEDLCDVAQIWFDKEPSREVFYADGEDCDTTEYEELYEMRTLSWMGVFWTIGSKTIDAVLMMKNAEENPTKFPYSRGARMANEIVYCRGQVFYGGFARLSTIIKRESEDMRLRWDNEDIWSITHPYNYNIKITRTGNVRFVEHPVCLETI